MRKPRNDKYRDGKKSQDGTLSCTIWAGVHIILDFYCKKMNINKTCYVNEAVKEKLERDMKDTKVEISMQDLFDIKNPEKQNTDKYEQMGFDIPRLEA